MREPCIPKEKAAMPNKKDSAPPAAPPHDSKKEEESGASPLFLGLLTLTCAVTGIAAVALKKQGIQSAVLPLFVASYISGGWAPVKEVLEAVRERRLDVNLLMVLAAAGAAVIGDWGEGATLLFLFSLSGALEKYTLERTARSIEALILLRPDTALVLRNGSEVRMAIEQILVGDRVRVAPGERVAVDGLVMEGRTTVDQSTITGESMPVVKKPGDSVFAGTLNQRGSITVEVQRASNETTLARIVRTVREAQDEKGDTERFVQTWQKPYVICVLLGSLMTALAHYYIPNGVPPNELLHHAMYNAMVLLVAASPCAVVIATPAATLAGLTRAARSGVLFKGGVYLEKLSDIAVLAFDKTGTLTKGEPVVVEIWASTRAKGSSSSLDARVVRPGSFEELQQGNQPAVGLASLLQPNSGEPRGLQPAAETPAGSTFSPVELRLLQLAASVELFSEHPLAQAVVDEARRQKLELLPVSDFDSHTAQGVHAKLVVRPCSLEGLQQGKQPAVGLLSSLQVNPVEPPGSVWFGVGKLELFNSHRRPIANDVIEKAALMRAAGQTVLIAAAEDGSIAGLIGVADALRPEAAEVVSAVRKQGIQHVALLTGDHARVGEAVARQVGADQVRAGLLPEEKVIEIAAMRRRFGNVAMVGDGVNDAPALAVADVGIAMGGGGTDVALETADVVLMKNDLHGVATALWLSHRTKAAVSRGLLFAFSVIGVLVVSAMLNILPLWVAVIFHEGSTVLTVFSGLCLLIEKSPFDTLPPKPAESLPGGH
jgi:Cd2+/Zn2+-exporting ATPase